MATDHNSFSVLAELNSSVSGKIAAPVPHRELCPELSDLSDNPRRYSTFLASFYSLGAQKFEVP
jgi:hypothetical protein